MLYVLSSSVTTRKYNKSPKINFFWMKVFSYDAFSDLGVVLVPFGPKIESMVNMSNNLISPIYRLGRSLQAKNMQIKAYN